MVSIKKSKKPLKIVENRVRISLDSGRNRRLQPALASPRQPVVTPLVHARGCNSPRRSTRVGSSSGLRFMRAGTAPCVAHPALEFFVALSRFGDTGRWTRVGLTRVMIVQYRTNFIFHLFLNHNASKHLQSLHRTLQHLIRTMHAIWILKRPNS